MSACRLLASCAPYGFVEVTAARSPRPSGFIGLLVCHFFLIYPCLLFFSSFASSSCTSVPPSVVSKCMLEKCLFACCKTCFDKYQLQVNDTVYEHWRFFLPFSFHEGGRTNETSSFFFIFFPLHIHRMAPFSSYKGLFQAPCTHCALLKAFTTNVTATSTSCWSVSLNMGHAQNFCASPSRDNSQLLAHRYCRRAGITSCFNLSAKQQSNTMFLFFFYWYFSATEIPELDLVRLECPLCTTVLSFRSGFVCRKSIDLLKHHCWENCICLTISRGSYEFKSIEILVGLYRALQSTGASSDSAYMDSSQLCRIVLVSLKDLYGCLVKTVRCGRRTSSLCPAALCNQGWNNDVCLGSALCAVFRNSRAWRKLQVHRFLTSE